jgi:hypothetical protein
LYVVDVKVSLNMHVVTANGVGHAAPAMASAVAADINQSPRSWDGTGSPAGVPVAADGVGKFPDGVDWAQAEARRTNEMQSGAAIARRREGSGVFICASHRKTDASGCQRSKYLVRYRISAICCDLMGCLIPLGSLRVGHEECSDCVGRADTP